ncbi:hypothetical protein LCGC14_2857980, partial [marine sediment metagenome]
DISKGKILTWMSNASGVVAKARDRAGCTRQGSLCQGKIEAWAVLVDKIVEGRFDVENVLEE